LLAPFRLTMDLIRRIRALPAEQGGLTPAIAMSGRVTAQPCLEAGFHFHLSKPIEMLVLLDTVRDFIRSEKAGGAQWTVTLVPPNDIVVRFDGHVTAFDMRRAVDAVVELLACSPEKRRVIVDLTRLSGFDPSVGSAAQSVVWESRQRIRDVIIVGGTRLSHLVGRGVCMMLGLPCELRAATSA
jgi:hypothetical protein